ncbi:MAG: hypothetical protein E7011_04940 [Alphaproteobacteria bacterium]|nr:hypothetical protein [Alphaproteobacteria bacterium]
MINKIKSFEAGKKRTITYGGVMNTLNKISRNAGDNVAAFETNLKNADGKRVCGFSFDTHELGQQLSDLLDTLGFSFQRHYKKITPKGKGEIHIDPKHADAAERLFYAWSSWVLVEPVREQNSEVQAMWRKAVNLQR